MVAVRLPYLAVSLCTQGLTRYQCERRPSLCRLHAQPPTSVGETAVRGDARGAAILIDDLTVSRGSVQMIRDVCWRVEPFAKWGIVGPNGAGKSTLLKAIMGELLCDGGSVVIGTTQEVGYLQQTAVSGSSRTIYEEAASAMTTVEDARKKLEALQAKVASTDQPTEQTLKALDRALVQYDALGGYNQEKEVASVLHGLGFQDIHKKCEELSGGWQMRVSLARLLLSKPTLLLLDEPSNHLDVNARQWLTNYLKDYENGAMVLVTHDVNLLTAVSNIAEVNRGTLQLFKSCTYNQFLKEKKRRAMVAEKEYAKNVEKAAKLQSFVDKYGASATKASAAQSRVKQIEKMQREGLLDAPAEAIVAQRSKPHLILPEPPRARGEVLISLDDAKIGHGDAVLISDVNLEIKRGMRLLLRGPNGAGKSSVLRALRGSLPLVGGDRTPNADLRLGFFTQDLAQELDTSARAVDICTAYARVEDETISDQDARTVMGSLGLVGDKAIRLVGDLSGGEKARVALAMFALRASNVLLLDEPSNHLDAECIEALTIALSKWNTEDGAIVIVSHDKAFCESVDFTHVGTVAEGKLVVEQRGGKYADWELFDVSTQSPSLGMPTESSHDNPEKKEIDSKEVRKKIFNARKRIPKIEKQIEKAENEISRIEQEMLENGSDVGKLMDLTAERDAHEAKVLELMEEWEELEGVVALAD